MSVIHTVGDALALGRSRADGDRLTTTSAQALLAHITGKGRAWLLAHPEAALSDEETHRYTYLLERAAAGEPLAHLTGEREFYGLAFSVTPDVLVPRPETEAVVEMVLDWLAARKISEPRLVDVGTGSGAIAITLAVYHPNAHITAVEISREALDMARENAHRHSVQHRVHFVQSDLLSAFADSFDVIAANLPYINHDEISALEVGRWEPRVALDGGEDGLVLVRRLLESAPERLAASGLLVLEIGCDQGSRVAALCKSAFPHAKVDVRPDLAKLDRIVVVDLDSIHD